MNKFMTGFVVGMVILTVTRVSTPVATTSYPGAD